METRPGNGRSPGDGVPRDAVVIGASAGGVEALTTLARNLPADLPAALLVVLHLPATATSRLPEILGRAGPLPAAHPQHGELPIPGRFYVAPPDRHMIVSGGRIFLIDGPRENGVRPAIDPLFRSAAAAWGERTVGVILSGTLDDGAAGMAAVQGFGGATIVQDPLDALSDGMPRAVLEVVEPDHVVPAAGIGSILASLASGNGKPKHAGNGRQDSLVADPMTLTPAGTDLVCPDCGGSLAEVAVGPLARFRCRVGHVYSPESLYGMKTGELEAGLWAALRTLEESASIAKRLADRSRRSGSTGMARRFEQRQSDAATRADVVRQALHSLSEIQGGTAREEVVTAMPGHDEGGRHQGSGPN